VVHTAFLPLKISRSPTFSKVPSWRSVTFFCTTWMSATGITNNSGSALLPPKTASPLPMSQPCVL
jgi:hypothetical protein